MSNRLVIYHAGCADGFCAAWLLWGQFPDAEFLPANYGDAPPDVTGKTVCIVDFSYPRDVLVRMNEQAEMMTVLDHHKSAKEALEGLPFCRFNMKKSGARMTWEYIQWNIHGNRIGERPVPWLVSYTEDRDLWLWQLPESREVNACLRSFPMTFEEWNRIALLDIDEMEIGGSAILRDQQMTVDIKVKQAHLVHVAAEPEFPNWMVCNATTLISETAGELAKTTGVGCCWFEMADGARVYSLRTCKESNVDCSVIAKLFGGGGHPGAAGFKLDAGVPHPWNSVQKQGN